MPDQAVSKPWRHWLRISVLGQIVLVLIIGAALSRLVHGARLQHDAVATIRKAGGSIYYDWQCLFECCGKKSRDPRPRWLADQLGIDYFGHVKYVFCDASNADSLLIRHLSQVEWLDLRNSGLTEFGLSSLLGFDRLRHMQLGGTKIIDAGLVRFERFTGLSWLEVPDTGVSDEGLRRLELLTHLETLDLRGTRVTDIGVHRLQKALPNLKIIR
jgi:hypothetical protein